MHGATEYYSTPWIENLKQQTANFNVTNLKRFLKENFENMKEATLNAYLLFCFTLVCSGRFSRRPSIWSLVYVGATFKSEFQKIKILYVQGGAIKPDGMQHNYYILRFLYF